MTDEMQGLRDRLAEQLRSAGQIVSPLVDEAFRAVPRHLFLPHEKPQDVYRDEAFAIKQAQDRRWISSSSQPAIMAIMLEQLALEPGHRILEIGAGTGYNAALMAHVVGDQGAVTTIDIDEDLADGARAHLRDTGFSAVHVARADGAFGYPERAPYDRIVLTVGAWDLEPSWLEQLAEGGRLVVPLSLRGAQRSVAFERADGHLRGVSIRDCGFMRLRGAGAGPESAITLGEQPGLFVELDDARSIDAVALYRALAEPGDDVASGVRVSHRDLWGGLGLWLALNEPGMARLQAIGEAVHRGLVPPLIVYPGQAATLAILGKNNLATLVPPRDGPVTPFEVAARGFGADGNELARRLVAHVRDWGQPRPAFHHRPSDQRLPGRHRDRPRRDHHRKAPDADRAELELSAITLTAAYHPVSPRSSVSLGSSNRGYGPTAIVKFEISAARMDGRTKEGS